jgi:type I restriction-modification system DNA methylase subunit
MLTRDQEKRSTSTFTNLEFRQANSDRTAMKNGDPEIFLSKLIDFKSKDLRVNRDKLINILMDLSLDSELLGHRPKPESKYAYTFEWFIYFIEKLKIQNRIPSLLNTFKSKPKGLYLGNPETNLVKLIKDKAYKLNTKPHLLLPKLVNSYFNYLVKEEVVCSKNKEYYETYQYFKFYLLKSITLNPFKDVFGHLMNEVYNFDKKHLGQCMTPPDLAKAVTSLMNAHYPKTKNQDVLNIGDMCGCGTGTLILSLMEKVKENKELFILINDIDLDMSQIALIQTYLHANIHCTSEKITIHTYNCNTLLDYSQGSGHMLCNAVLTKPSIKT